jgi:hypothetical protein
MSCPICGANCQCKRRGPDGLCCSCHRHKPRRLWVNRSSLNPAGQKSYDEHLRRFEADREAKDDLLPLAPGHTETKNVIEVGPLRAVPQKREP